MPTAMPPTTPAATEVRRPATGRSAMTIAMLIAPPAIIATEEREITSAPVIIVTSIISTPNADKSTTSH